MQKPEWHYATYVHKFVDEAVHLHDKAGNVVVSNHFYAHCHDEQWFIPEKVMADFLRENNLIVLKGTETKRVTVFYKRGENPKNIPSILLGE